MKSYADFMYCYGDLNINAENTEQFSYEHMVFGRYLDDIVTGG